MRNIERFGFIFYSLSITVKPHSLSGSSSTLSHLLLDGSRGRCQGCLRCASSSRRLPFQPKGSSDLGGEESALQIALNQSQRQTQWFTEVNPEGKVPVVKFDDKWVADFDVIVGIIEENYPEPSLKIPPKFASVRLGMECLPQAVPKEVLMDGVGQRMARKYVASGRVGKEKSAHVLHRAPLQQPRPTIDFSRWRRSWHFKGN